MSSPKGDTHTGQFGMDCGSCRKIEGWNPTAVERVKCHVKNVYKGTPKTCVGCHQDLAYHLAAFGAAVLGLLNLQAPSKVEHEHIATVANLIGRARSPPPSKHCRSVAPIWGVLRNALRVAPRPGHIKARPF
jgi:hypothetical protein